MKKIFSVIRNNREIGERDNPDFDKARKCHDWRNHIPDNVRELWSEMSVEARVVAYLMAERQAAAEEWD